MDRDLLASAPVISSAPEHPAHMQIERWLADAIDQGVVRPGQRLPGERALANALGVSRMTLRQAMSGLEQRGLIRRQPGGGGGAFVTEAGFDVDLTNLAGLSAQIVRANLTAGAEVVTAHTINGAPAATASLGLAPDEQVHEIVRVRLASGTPVGIERSCFPAALFPDLLSRPLDGSLYATLREVYGRTPATAREYVRPVEASEQDAGLLRITPGVALLAVERTAYDGTDVPVEYSVDVFRSDRMRILVHSSLTDTPR